MQQPDVSDLVTTLPKPIKWVIPDSISTDHATHLVVQQQGSEFTFLFFETEPLLFTGSLEEQVAAYKELPEVKAKCVVKVVMSAENAIGAANNLIESINRFNTMSQAMMAQAMKGQENAGAETHENTKLSASS